MFVGINKGMYINLKCLYIKSLTTAEIYNQERIGGIGSVFQVYETAMCAVD
jgi:hypothetical protein